MSEREGTAEDLARLFGEEPREPTDEEVEQVSTSVDTEAAEAGEETGPTPTEDEDGSQFLWQLFEPKRGEVEWIRALHGDGSV